MKKIWTSIALFTGSLCLFSSPAWALADGWYGTLGAGWSHSLIGKGDTIPEASSVNPNAVGYRVAGGFQFSQNFALEADYFFFSRYRYNSSAPTANGYFTQQVVELNAVGILPLAERFGAKVKVGGYNDYIKRSGGLMFSGNSKRPHSGFGVDYNVGAFFSLLPTVDISLEYDQLLKKPSTILVSGNISYHFGVN